MKSKFVITIISLAILPQLIFSQTTNTPFYVKVYGAYGFLSPGSFKSEPSKPLRSDTSFFKVGKKGMGEGIRVGIGFGLILSDYVNIGIDGEYLFGSTIEIPVNQSYLKTTATKKTVTTVNSMTTINHSILSIIPNITFKAVSKPSYHIYTRLGIVVGIPLEITQDYMSTQTDKNSPFIPGHPVHIITTTYHAEYELKMGIGYQAALGVQVKISDKFRAFGEISGYRLSLNRIKYEETKRFRRESTGQAIGPDPDDFSRNMIHYKKEGSTNIEQQGSINNYLYLYTDPQEAINVNSITAGMGIFYRF